METHSECSVEDLVLLLARSSLPWLSLKIKASVKSAFQKISELTVIAGGLANSIRNRTSLKFGLYHSLLEWFNPLYLKDKESGWKTQLFSLVNVIKGCMSWPKVSLLAFRFWSLPWTNGANIQLKWKLRYSPIQFAHLVPSLMHFSDHWRKRIGLEIGNYHRAFGVCIDFSAYALIFGKRSRGCMLEL